MVMLVGLNEAKAQLQVDHNQQDAHIEMLIHACSGAVLNYLKRDVADLDSDNALEVDSDGVIIMEWEVTLATLYLVGVMFRDRDGPASIEQSSFVDQGYLPRPVTALLYPLRDPTAA
jgi:hypothetical protein